MLAKLGHTEASSSLKKLSFKDDNGGFREHATLERKSRNPFKKISKILRFEGKTARKFQSLSLMSADSLSPLSRAFYEQTKYKFVMSVFLFSLGILSLAFNCYYSGSMSA